jgi:RimJ/RimL family protein N-acetyltransferase
LRPIKPADDVNLLDLYTRLSPESLYHRFFTVPKADPAYARYLASVDSENHFALVAEIGDHIVAVARFHRLVNHSVRAEAAFTVADAWQGQGIGSLLFKKLADVALQKGVNEFECQVAMDNERMAKLIAGSGFQFKKERRAGFFMITILLESNTGHPRKSLIRKAGKI